MLHFRWFTSLIKCYCWKLNFCSAHITQRERGKALLELLQWFKMLGSLTPQSIDVYNCFVLNLMFFCLLLGTQIIIALVLCSSVDMMKKVIIRSY